MMIWKEIIVNAHSLKSMDEREIFNELLHLGVQLGSFFDLDFGSNMYLIWISIPIWKII